MVLRAFKGTAGRTWWITCGMADGLVFLAAVWGIARGAVITGAGGLCRSALPVRAGGMLTGGIAFRSRSASTIGALAGATGGCRESARRWTNPMLANVA